MVTPLTITAYIEKLRSATNIRIIGNIIAKFPSLVYSQNGVNATLQHIPRVVKINNERSFDLYFIQTILNLCQKRRCGIDTYGEYGTDSGNGSVRTWPIDILRCYVGAVIDQSEGLCLDQLNTEENRKFIIPLGLESIYEFMGFLMFLYDFKAQTGYSRMIWSKYVSSHDARVGFLNVFADIYASLYACGVATHVLSRIWERNLCCNNDPSLKWPFMEILEDANIGKIQEQALPIINDLNETIYVHDKVIVSDCLSDVTNLFIHLSNVVKSDFSKQTYLFEYLSMIATEYSLEIVRRDVSLRYNKYFEQDTAQYMVDLIDVVMTQFGSLESYQDESQNAVAYNAVAKVTERIIFHIKRFHQDVDRRVVELFFKDTLKTFGWGIEGASYGALNALDAILQTVYADYDVKSQSMESFEVMDSIEALALSYEAMEADAPRKAPTGATTTDDLTKHKKATVKPGEALKSAERKIANGFHKYKEAEQNIDGQLAKGANMLKNAITGDQRSILVEGKQFSPIGFFKKVIGTVAIFNYSKIAFILGLIVKKTMTRKVKVTERRKILQELEEELVMVNEKIEDARGDGNREAKYALMRSKAALENAIKRIKFGIGAEGAKGSLSSETTGYRG